MLTIPEKFEGCIIGGAIGDAWGSSYENETLKASSTTYFLNLSTKTAREWAITDDTQLTLATCEALFIEESFSPQLLSQYFVKYYRTKRITGIGSSTLKALKELEIGGHWSQVGRAGEYAAGNGAAMRIAPLGFHPFVTREAVRDVCRITHKNDEAYTGALAVFLAIKSIMINQWTGKNDLISIILTQLPDTRLRDRLIEINSIHANTTIADAAGFGNSGYVVDSVPFAIFSAMQVKKIGFKEMLQQIIATGGDTDTNASIAGQIAGALLGIAAIPSELIDRLQKLKSYKWINEIVTKTKTRLQEHEILNSRE